MIIPFKTPDFQKFTPCFVCFELFTKIKKGLRLVFSAHFLHTFTHKNNPYSILFRSTKFQYQTHFPSQDIKQNVSKFLFSQLTS